MIKRTVKVYVLSLVMAVFLSACGNASNVTTVPAPSGTPPVTSSDASTTTTKTSPSDIHTTSAPDNSASTISKTCMIDKWHNIFFGTIGTEEICMDIHQDGNEITAFCVYKGNDNEIKLVGSLDGFEISLKDDNQDTLTGTVTSADEIGHFQGTFTQSNGNKLPVVLDMSYACGDSLDNFYELMGSNNQEVDTFVSELKNNVTSVNKQAVAEIIYYPINVFIEDKSTTINSSQEFIDNYDKIMNKDFVNTISNAYTKLLFHNYQGAMFGGDFNNFWIQNMGDDLMIIGINN